MRSTLASATVCSITAAILQLKARLRYVEMIVWQRYGMVKRLVVVVVFHFFIRVHTGLFVLDSFKLSTAVTTEGGYDDVTARRVFSRDMM